MKKWICLLWKLLAGHVCLMRSVVEYICSSVLLKIFCFSSKSSKELMNIYENIADLRHVITIQWKKKRKASLAGEKYQGRIQCEFRESVKSHRLQKSSSSEESEHAELIAYPSREILWNLAKFNRSSSIHFFSSYSSIACSFGVLKNQTIVEYTETQ